MQSVDMDANGAIDYTEFISATINKSKLLTKERLKTAFDHFDKVLKFYFQTAIFRITQVSLTYPRSRLCWIKARRLMTRCGVT